jgi:hypothetical protein
MQKSLSTCILLVPRSSDQKAFLMHTHAKSMSEIEARLTLVLGQTTPAYSAEAQETADLAIKETINFVNNGKTPTHVGPAAQIDWSAPHHKHQEWRCQLNRFFWLSGLIATYRQTHVEAYAKCAKAYIDSWINAHAPYTSNWQRAKYDFTLDLGVRMGGSQWPGWTGALLMLAESESFDEAFAQKMIDAISAQMDNIAREPAPGINWRIANADALIVVGLRLGHLPQAALWRRAGVALMNDAAHRQILADGAHFERTPGYHHWMLRVFEKFFNLARAFPELALDIPADLVDRMYDFATHTQRPNLEYNALHDSQGDRSTPATKAGTGSQGVDYRALWQAFRRDAGLPEPATPTSRYFPIAGQHYARTEWSPEAAYFSFDASNWGGGHCHLSRNSIQFHAHGKTLLCDPGWLTYESSDPLSYHGKSTTAHNTLTFTGHNQSFSNNAYTTVRHGPHGGYDLVRSDYEGGYWKGNFNWGFPDGMSSGIWASHCRIALFVHDLGVLVIDGLYAEENHLEKPTYETNWQFMEGSNPVVDHVGKTVRTRFEDANLLALFAHAPEGAQLHQHEGSREPLRGWLASSKGIIPAPQVCLRAPAMTKPYADFVTFLMPFKGAQPPKVTAAAVARRFNEVSQCVLTHADGATDSFYWTYRLDQMLGLRDYAGPGAGLETDASMLHLRHDAAGKLVRIAGVDGTFLRPFSRTRLEKHGVIVADV